MEAWNEFIDMKLEAHRQAFSLTPEYQLRQSVRAQLDDMMENNLTADQRVMMEDILLTRSEMEEQDIQRLYRQGMKDAVWLMRELGVLG